MIIDLQQNLYSTNKFYKNVEHQKSFPEIFLASNIPIHQFMKWNSNENKIFQLNQVKKIYKS